MDKYKIYDVSDVFSSGAVEYLGGKRKGWFTLNMEGRNLRVLFKQGRPGTGENWAEKVACELAKLLGLPHASYELGYFKGESCVISPSFLEEGEELRLGNQLIDGLDHDLRFGNSKHTLNAILNVLQNDGVRVPWKTLEQESAVKDAIDLFIGYLCFDAWILNTDRHAENWGIITRVNHIKALAPTFDHASSLGRNESDEKRIERLKTKDRGFNVQAYAQRANAPIYDEQGKQLSILSLMKECKKVAPKATDYWIKRINDLMDERGKIEAILERIPDTFITDPARNFAMAILNASLQKLREL